MKPARVRLIGLRGALTGWLFDVLIGVFLASILLGLPLALLGEFVGDPGHLLTIVSGAAGLGGVIFMRTARRLTGPAWFVN